MGQGAHEVMGSAAPGAHRDPGAHVHGPPQLDDAYAAAPAAVPNLPSSHAAPCGAGDAAGHQYPALAHATDGDAPPAHALPLAHTAHPGGQGHPGHALHATGGAAVPVHMFPAGHTTHDAVVPAHADTTPEALK